MAGVNANGKLKWILKNIIKKQVYNMSRPIRKRRLGFMPENHYFSPDVFCTDGCRELNITHDELESIRLSDLEKMEQTEASKLMDISRGTYQRILISARKKIANALINGRAIKVLGGEYVLKDCISNCTKCNHNWKAPCNVLFNKKDGGCPQCGSNNIKCSNSKGECSLGEKRHIAMQLYHRKHLHRKKQMQIESPSKFRFARINDIVDKMDDERRQNFLDNCRK